MLNKSEKSDVRSLGTIVLFAIAACCSLIGVNGCGQRDLIDQHFVDTVDAAQQKAFSPDGRLPVWIPPSSKDIRLRFSAHTEAVWVAFIWDGATRGRLDECVLSPITAVWFPKTAPDWWAADLAHSHDGGRLEATYDLKICPDQGVFAIEHGTPRGFYWRLGS